MFSILLDVYLGVEFLAHRITLHLLDYFPKWLNYFTFPPMGYEVCNFPTSSTNIYCYLSFWLYEVISHCDFGMHYSYDYWGWTFLMCLLAIYVSSLERCVYNSFAYFKLDYLFFLLSCKSPLYVVDTRFLSGTWFSKVFSHSVGLFIFLIVFFETQ